MEPEVWKDIPGFSNYRISTYGRIASKHTKSIMSLSQDKDGYLGTVITDDLGNRKNIKVHRIVLITFKGPPPSPDYQCRHFPDPDKTNNHIDNLHWGNNIQNQLDHLKFNIHHNQHGDCLSEQQVINIKNKILSGTPYKVLQKDFGVTENQLVHIRTGKKYWYYGPDITHLHNLRSSRKFTDAEIRDIRSSNLSNSDEARNRGVTSPCISKIRLRKTYGDVI